MAKRKFEETKLFMPPEYWWVVCRETACRLWYPNPPTTEYARDVTMLLLGTAATESHFLADRQTGFGWIDRRGAWGPWQIEEASVTESLKMLFDNPTLANRAAQLWYECDTADGIMFASMTPLRACRLMMQNDRLSSIFARLHYRRVPDPIPHGVDAQSKYYKQYYNTVYGKGSTEKYKEDWDQYVTPILEAVGENYG